MLEEPQTAINPNILNLLGTWKISWQTNDYFGNNTWYSVGKNVTFTISESGITGISGSGGQLQSGPTLTRVN